MDDHKSPESDTPVSDSARQKGDFTQSSTVDNLAGNTEIPVEPAPYRDLQPQNTYAHYQAQPQAGFQQPNPGVQPQNPYQTPGAYQQPGYYRPQPYPPQYYDRNHPSRTKATASLVLGIISLVFFWMSFLAVISVICSIIGIVLGNSARKELRPEQGQGQATAGLVCSIIGLVLSVMMIVIFTLIMVLAFSNIPEYGIHV